MTEVAFTWSEANRARILSRRKSSTTRRSRHAARGDYFMLDGRKFEITSVWPMALGDVAELHYHPEGYDTREEFLADWSRLYGLLVPPNLTQIVYLHEFIEVLA
jgi:hypothetical protein